MWYVYYVLIAVFSYIYFDDVYNNDETAVASLVSIDLIWREKKQQKF